AHSDQPPVHELAEHGRQLFGLGVPVTVTEFRMAEPTASVSSIICDVNKPEKQLPRRFLLLAGQLTVGLFCGLRPRTSEPPAGSVFGHRHPPMLQMLRGDVERVREERQGAGLVRW